MAMQPPSTPASHTGTQIHVPLASLPIWLPGKAVADTASAWPLPALTEEPLTELLAPGVRPA